MYGNPTAPTPSRKFIAKNVDHSPLSTANALSIRVFLRVYDQYAVQIEARAHKLVRHAAVPTKPVTPLSLKFCVDPKWLDSTLAPGFIERFTTVDNATNIALRGYPES